MDLAVTEQQTVISDRDESGVRCRTLADERSQHSRLVTPTRFHTAKRRQSEVIFLWLFIPELN